MRKLFLCLWAVGLLLVAGAASADVVIDWNKHALAAIKTGSTNPPAASRVLAITQVSVFDAVNAASGKPYTAYHFDGSAPAGASAEAAAVSAAHRALVALFPTQQADLDAKLAVSLAAIPDGPGKTDGIAFGKTVADAILALRANDGASTVRPFEFPEGANWWAKTPPAFASPLLPNWPNVTPWAMNSGDQLRPPAPPPTNTSEYAAAYNEVALIGYSGSTIRTADQTQIALFWADGPGTITPPGHWHQIAQTVSQEEHLSLIQNARLFALLGITVADAAIVSWDAKYAYCNWRPVTGIQNGELDGNPDTHPDPRWTSLIGTPPFPSYTSGHSTFSGSSARLLALFFGTDNISFSSTSDGLPGVTRHFTSFSQASNEAGQSRIYGGIHWQFDNKTGLASGRSLGDVVFFGFLTPSVTPGTCSPNATTACLNDGRFKVQANWKTPTSSGPANVASQDGDSGQFYFFQPDNTELIVKVLNGCGFNDEYWVFASGLTNVEVLVTVTDTHAGKVRQYFNPQGKAFAPVQDTSAFATCP